ncbi:MAG: cytochrome b/b6 domain-containing protein [Deltaproteobacteria bacterium]|nr:cytochrome b/b6 domain-containing protein [Deltaproteobacteria bacterium]
MTPAQIHRHTRLSIFMHWFNAGFWIFLLLTGLGLIQNNDLQPFTSWPMILRNIFGGGANLLLAHEIAGITWAGGFLLYGIIRLKSDVIPFIREIFTVNIPRDFLWLITKGIQMTLGYKMLGVIAEKFGFSPKIPDQGFYNVGQKIFAIPAVFGGMVIAASGIIMSLSQTGIASTWLVQWAILIHFVTVGLVFAGLLIHVFMASIAAGEQPAFISMFTGTVPENYARHHHKLWLDEVKKS